MNTVGIAGPAIVRPSALRHSLRVEPVVPALGAEILDVSLSDAIHDADLAAELARLWRQYKVLFFRDQHALTNAEHQAFAELFGELEEHPVVKGTIPEAPLLLGISNFDPDGNAKKADVYENVWHSDVTFTAIPAAGAVLRQLEGPAVGGDTMWCNMAMVYETLPEDVKQIIDGLHAKHCGEQVFFARLPAQERLARGAKYPQAEHPVVATHPVTAERCLYVNGVWTTHFSDYYRVERARFGATEFGGGAELLRYLVNRVLNPEFQVRLRWRPGTIAMWDNMLTQHYAVRDYSTARRMVRATLKGFPIRR